MKKYLPTETQELINIIVKNYDKSPVLEFRSNLKKWVITFTFDNKPFFITMDKSLYNDNLKTKHKKRTKYVEVTGGDIITFRKFYEIPLGKSFGFTLQNKF